MEKFIQAALRQFDFMQIWSVKYTVAAYEDSCISIWKKRYNFWNIIRIVNKSIGLHISNIIGRYDGRIFNFNC